ncbi:hypothetical protein Tco_1021744, partial [Tanacetum coccineum]
YLKGKPKLGLWYPRLSSFDLEAYSNSDYARANLDRKSTTGGCQFLGRRLISWQCKKQTIIATSTTEAEYVAAANCCGHHFIRDAYEKKLIQVLKIHTDDNVADLLTKTFDVSSTDSAKLVPLGKDSTAIETLKKIPPRVQTLISLSPTITTSTIMVVLELCPKHNMVAYVEKTDRNAEFHDIIDFLARSYIHNALTGKHFSGKVIPLFASILVQPTEDEGTTSERPSEPQLTPSPPYPSKANVEPQSELSPRSSLSAHIPDSIPERSGGNHGGQSSSDKSLSGNVGDMTLQSVYDLCISLCTQVTNQAKEIKHLKAQIKKLKKKAKPVITHHKAWMKSVSLKKSLARKKSKESVSKQGRKSAKAEPSVNKDPLFDELPDDTMDYMDIEDAQDVGRTRDVVNKEKESAEDAVSTEGVVSTDRQNVSTDRPNISTDRPKVNTDKENNSTVSPDEGTDDRTDERSATPTTPTTTPTMFGDDETIAQSERPRPTSTRSLLTLKPLPKIDPKDKGKKKIEEEDESDTEFKGIPKAEKKFKQLARDEEMARKVQEDWEAEEEVKKLAEEEAIKTALSNEYDFIQERIEADRLLALRLQDEEREQFIMEERAMFLHDSIAAQRRFLAEQRKHSDQKSKTFEEIQALYEKVKRFDESFTAVGSTKDERRIKEMNEGVKDTDQKSLKKRVVEKSPKTKDTVKVPARVDVTDQGTKKRKGGHIKMIARKRKRPQVDVNSNDDHRKCLKIVTFEGTMDSEIMERKSIIARL